MRAIMMARVRQRWIKLNCTFNRGMADHCNESVGRTGLVLGAYDGCNPGEFKMTATANKYDDEMSGAVRELLKGSGLGLGKANVYNNLGSKFFAVAVAGLGPEGLGFNENENLNECKENIRIASAMGAKALQEAGVTNIMVEGFTDAEAAAEGAALAVWRYQEFKNKANKETVSNVHLFDDPDKESWERGMHKAESQNIARLLEETPANLMTPSIFAQKAIEILCPCGVQVEVRDRKWMEEKKLSALLELTNGSCEPPLVLELAYCGGSENDKPVVMVGKGTTYDSGGMCLKQPALMAEYKADMAGAAVIVGTMKAMAVLGVPINVNALLPLYENMPGGRATKPGDIIIGLSGKTVRMDDTAREARVALSDVLTYTINYKPCLVVNVATLTDGIRAALGASSTGVFTTSNIVWNEISRAGADTGDRVWRMPLWKYFSNKISGYAAFDLNNIGRGRGGDPCMGAAFLTNFAPPVDLLHLDITGSGMLSTGIGFPYIRAGTMSGRPTRTLIQFLYQMACPQDKGSVC